jgi:hypothetical protein
MNTLLTNTNDTYASVVAKNSRNSGHSLIVRSQIDSVSGDVMESTLRKKINVRSKGIGIVNIKKLKNDKILINCVSEEDRSNMKREIADQTDLITEEPKRKKPLIIIKGIIKGITDEDLNESIQKQNKKLQIVENIRILFRKRNRNSLMANLVCRVEPDTWRSLTTEGKISVGYQRLVVEDFSPVVQCYNCLEFGHMSKFCENKIKCPYCGEEHPLSDCERKTNGQSPICSNCRDGEKDSNHSATRHECAIWKFFDKKMREMTDYGEFSPQRY